jgi:L-serine dehydratase
MKRISVFDMLKIGVGPSSSHTLGPWRAAERWIQELKNTNDFNNISSIKIDLYGSLSLTGKGHATDLAILLGLSGADPEYVPIKDIDTIITNIKKTNTLDFNGERAIIFNTNQIVFNKEFLPFHPNGVTFTGENFNGQIIKSTFYSIGGGFISKENEEYSNIVEENLKIPYPIQRAKELLNYCNIEEKMISEIVLANEIKLKTNKEIDTEILRIWETMLECIYIGCHSEGFFTRWVKR